MRRWARASALILTLTACGRGTASRGLDPAPVTATATLGAEAAAARDAVTAFITAEAGGERGADTLLAAEADFIMTGIAVTQRPRLAGLNGPGQAVVEAATTRVGGALAWVTVVYRFESPIPDLNERGRGTFVLERQRAGWRIRHVHTSMVERWDR